MYVNLRTADVIIMTHAGGLVSLHVAKPKTSASEAYAWLMHHSKSPVFLKKSP